MNPSLLLEEIKTKLINENHLAVIKEINERISSASTGSEIWASVGHYLKHLDMEKLRLDRIVLGKDSLQMNSNFALVSPVLLAIDELLEFFHVLDFLSIVVFAH